MFSLRHARGRYTAERASQLSGVPKSTVYDWQRERIYVPDYAGGTPMAWSYRDLVYLRVLAWLRQNRMPRPIASEHVAKLKAHVAAGHDVTDLWADSRHLGVEGDGAEAFEAPGVLFPEFLARFDITDALHEEFRQKHLWGPDLVTPSDLTYISPWVLGGDPCLDGTRIQTASVFTLRTERGLRTEDIVELYPDLDADRVEDAFDLEVRLRGTEELIGA
jgi:uncharacterized protein (DUF433 family)